MNRDYFGWGILGARKFARQFAHDIANAGLHLAAVDSRERARAQAFADDHSGHSAYEDLVTDPAVDLVYVATP